MKSSARPEPHTPDNAPDNDLGPLLPSPPLGPVQIASIHALFLLTGMGAMLLGPLLPSLAGFWHLRDQQTGLLIAAQFIGSFAGSTTLRKRLKQDLGVACLILVLGFTGLALAATHPQGFLPGLATLACVGFGLGRGITAINLIAGSRIRRHRASALALLNLTWGIGAILAPFSVALFAESLQVRGIIAGYAILLAILSLFLWHSIPEADRSSHRTFSAPALAASGTALVYFGWLFFFYGGLEAGASNWISLFSIRSTHGTLRQGADVATSLWMGLTAGRALASLLFLRLGERSVFCGGMLLAASASLLLARAHAESSLIALAILVGFGLAPGFPALSSLLLASPRHPRHAGAIMAASSLGGAVFPWLIGVVSQHTGSWRTALAVPLALALILVLLIVIGRLHTHAQQLPQPCRID